MTPSAAYFTVDARECSSCRAYLADYFGQPDRVRSCADKCVSCCPCASCMELKNDDGCVTCVRCGVRTDDFETYTWGSQCVAYFECSRRIDANRRKS